MEKINISKYCEVFAVKGVRVLNDLDGKKSIFYLPEGFICYVDEGNGGVSFEKFTAEFKVFEEKVCFSVCVDDSWYIDKNFKLVDDETARAFFGDSTPKKKYNSIHGRVAAVYSALCEGKIRLGSLEK